MDKVLVVDNDKSFLELLEKGLNKFRQFEIHTADSKSKSVLILNSSRISVLILSGDNPSIDPVGLLSYMSRYHDKTPCIVMMRRKKPWFSSHGNKDAFLYYLENPLNISALASAIIVGLNQCDLGVNVSGMSMAGLLPLFEALEKTGELRTGTPQKRQGNLVFSKGRICDAQYGKFTGEAAAKEIALLRSVAFTFSDYPVIQAQGKIYPTPVKLAGAVWSSKAPGGNQKTEILFEGKEEIGPIKKPSTGEREKPVRQPKHPFLRKIPAAGGGKQKMPVWDKDGVAPLFEKIFAGIRHVKGYRGAALLDETGDLVAFDRTDEQIDLESMAGFAIELYENARFTVKNMRMEEMSAFTLHTNSGHLVVRQFEAGPGVHVYAMLVCAFGGNWFYLKNRLENLAVANRQASRKTYINPESR